MKRDIFQIVGVWNSRLWKTFEMSYRLNRLGIPVCSRKKLITSSRRWGAERHRSYHFTDVVVEVALLLGRFGEPVGEGVLSGVRIGNSFKMSAPLGQSALRVMHLLRSRSWEGQNRLAKSIGDLAAYEAHCQLIRYD